MKAPQNPEKTPPSTPHPHQTATHSPCTLPFLAFLTLPLRGLEKMDFHPLTGDFFPLLASLLDFFLSHDTPLSYYVIIVGILVGFFPVIRYVFILLGYCWRHLCWIFSLSHDTPLSYYHWWCLLDFFPIIQCTITLFCYHCWHLSWIFSRHTIHLYLIMLSVLVSLLDLSLSNDSPLSM